VNGFVYCSGQIGWENNQLSGDFETECRVALNRVKALLEAAGKRGVT
jgi:enamine deaminase RidA (YjgF/YER057c/UK114 family)